MTKEEIDQLSDVDKSVLILKGHCPHCLAGPITDFRSHEVFCNIYTDNFLDMVFGDKINNVSPEDLVKVKYLKTALQWIVDEKS